MRIAIVEGTRDEIRDVLRDFRDQIDGFYEKPKLAPLPTSSNVILRAVSKRTGATARDLMGRTRNRDTSYARHLAMYLLAEDGAMPVGEIAALFERDHSTVIQGVERIEGETKTRPETLADVYWIRENVKP